MKNIVTALFLYDILTEDSAADINGCAARGDLAEIRLVSGLNKGCAENRAGPAPG